MKLAEALLLRAEYQQKIVNLQGRLAQNLKVQEGEQPHEDPEQLLQELLSLNDKLVELIKKVNLANMQTPFDERRTLADALVEREILAKKRQILTTAVSNANQRDYRLTHAEVKLVVTVDIARLQKQIDQLSKEFRELDTAIQARNWTVDLE
ncbi:hypothetical protein CUZ56_01055 [Saezia sanguinis]|uniref:Septicolysin n=1 Tax=Saezia sanguinis TaxID=1965230 RepID=A0A433SEJ5_9BURK|nr:DIP1984 family protein [Saezia sanguinis]RUS67116.1 hypothetical protein CUZ56_01055 [Saezia sanguinis]